MAYATFATLGGRGLVAGLRTGEKAAGGGAALAVITVCVSYCWVDWS
jgi:hypothetical protein